MSRPGSRASLQGHMALKSSAYKPTINKLSSQYLIQDQMASHYYNLATIKSAIDSKPPKSSSLSIKKQDQLKRDALIKKINSPYSEPMANGYSSQRTAKSHRNDYMTSQRQRNQKPRPTSYDDTYGDFNTTKRTSDLNKSDFMSKSWTGVYEVDHHSSSSSRSSKSGNAGQSNRKSKTKTPAATSPRAGIMDLTYSGDYLDRHKERFDNKDNAAFTPRTKKRKGKSYLSQSKHYAPPVVIQQKNKKASDKKRDEAVTEDNVQRLESSHNSERDEDHRRWIEEQTEYVQRLSLVEKESSPPSRSSSRNWLRTSTLDRTSTRKLSTGGKSETMRRIEAEEEELKYIAFINEITNDILTRGIYSDSVLNQTMERHVQSKKHELDETKMRNMLIKLRRDLGMSDNLPPATSMLSTTNTFEPASFTSGSLYNTKGKSKSSVNIDEEYLESDKELLASSQLLSTQASGSRRTLNPTPSMTSISSLHTDRGVSGAKAVAEDLSEVADGPQLTSSFVTQDSSHDVTVIERHSPVSSKPATPRKDPEGVGQPPKEDTLKKTITTTEEDQPSTSANVQAGSEIDQTRTKSSSSDESDYESVAALSMAIKLKESEDLDQTLKDQNNETLASQKDDGAYSDDFDDDF